MERVGELVGVWRLVSLQSEAADGSRTDMYGPDPHGRAIFTADGRMMAILTAGDRTAMEGDGPELFRNLTAYSGRYRIEDGRFITTVDISWHPSWLGTEQPRFFKIDGDILSITSPVQTHPQDPTRTSRGVIVWRREG